MRGGEFRSRDKKVHKLGRDGLVERNAATGEERRVSGRAADVSFDRGRDAGETARREPGRKPTKKKRRKQPVPQAPELIASIGALETAPAPDASEIPEAAPEMRSASDMPMLVPPPEPRDGEVRPRKKRRSPGKRRIYDQRDGSRLRNKDEPIDSSAVSDIYKAEKRRRAAGFSATLQQDTTQSSDVKAPLIGEFSPVQELPDQEQATQEPFIVNAN